MPESASMLLLCAPLPIGLKSLKTAVNTRKPTSPARAAAPSPPARPKAIPTAKIIGRLLNSAPPASAIKGIPVAFGFCKIACQISACPRRRSRAATGNTAMGSMRERPRLCIDPRTRSQVLVVGGEDGEEDEGLTTLIRNSPLLKRYPHRSVN